MNEQPRVLALSCEATSTQAVPKKRLLGGRARAIIQRRAPLTQENFGQFSIEGWRISRGDSRPFRTIRGVALKHDVLTARPRTKSVDLTTSSVETTTI